MMPLAVPPRPSMMPLAVPPRPFAACAQCRRRKTRCDEQFPCSRCLRAGRGDDCSRPEAGDAALGTPTVTRGLRRRSSKACLSCQLKKVRCGEARPCARCFRTGSVCYEEGGLPLGVDLQGYQRRREQVTQACERCRRSRLKCDPERPCGRCVRSGQACLDGWRRRRQSGARTEEEAAEAQSCCTWWEEGSEGFLGSGDELVSPDSTWEMYLTEGAWGEEEAQAVVPLGHGPSTAEEAWERPAQGEPWFAWEEEGGQSREGQGKWEECLRD
ncbi:hypothetical protein GUITHDRAFT_114220 [Guillardia theta CCMP2712]|nr:hypothetical protein GUITHDRAFT_114220 [Guillardia theta CCMP2712]EKX39723.1 hypothetical protein GUITHDRAFT_114220 [Guillardia theta CCMP2712]|eukprot:XP_005826703.1 hypothetical protein GUITHDRAFT_114220 [Guillardia theta CCMP2712]